MNGDDAPDSDRKGRLPRLDKRTIAVAVVCFLIGVAGIAAAAHLANSVQTSGDVPLVAPDGMETHVVGTTQQDLTSNFPTSGTVEVVTEDGNVTFYSAGDANATVQVGDITGTWTTVTDITADPNTVQITPEDKDTAIVGQEIDTFAYRSGIALDDSTTDFQYTASGPARVTVQGVAADTQVAAVDSSTGTVLDTATTTGGGAVTFDALDSGDHDVQIQTFNPKQPTFSNPSPTGGVTEDPAEVSVDVSDGDFPRGDSVTVTIDVDGSQVHSETISSNQTVTASVPSSATTGGSHTWSVEASDSYGESNSASYNYEVPQNLTIRDEEPPNDLITQEVNLTVYTQGDDPEVLNYTVNGGEVDLGNDFPSGEPFIVVADSEGYLDRRILVESLYDTQTIYLLDENVTSTDVIFQIEDYSGSYPPDNTALKVQRGINGSWETVLGDYFGANDQFTSQLKYNTRHRLVLVNTETGDQRVLGSYTPLTSGTETLTVSPSGELNLPETHPTIEFSPTSRTLPQDSGVGVETTVNRGDMELTEWGVDIYNVDGNTNTSLYSDSSTDADGGTLSTTLNLDGLEGQVKVVTSYEVDGASGTQVAYYSIAGEPSRSMPLLDGLLALVGLVPNSDTELVLTLTSMIGIVVGTAAVGSAFRLSAEGMGLTTLGLATGFAVIGWVDYSLLFTLLVLFAALAFLRRRY